MALPHDLVRLPEACAIAETVGADDRTLCREVFADRLASYVAGGRLYLRRIDLDLWIRHCMREPAGTSAEQESAVG